MGQWWTATCLALVLGAASCDRVKIRAAHPEAAPAPAPGQTAAWLRCPASVPGVSVAYADTSDGARIEFVAPTFELTDLRSRVDRLAREHQALSNASHPDARSGSARASGGGIPDFPEASVTTENVPLGANVYYRPADPSRASEVRSRVRRFVDSMQRGDCTWH